MTDQYFNLKKPCKDCPFRTDNGFMLTVPRVQGICESLLRGESFPCHKTTTHDDDGRHCPDSGRNMHCAGAMIMLEHMGQPNQIMQVSERTGWFGGYDRNGLDMAAPVFKDHVQMINTYKERNRK